MTALDRGPFAELLLSVAEVYGEAFSDAKLEIYYAALADMELSAVRAALTAHVQTSKFFPRPAEIREAHDGDVADRAELAWGALLRMVRSCGSWWNSATQGPLPWPDDATRRAALELYGGWRALCENLPAAGPEMLGTAKLFKSTYGAYARREARGGPALPPSREEAKAVLSGLKLALVARGLPTGDEVKS